MIDTVKDEFLLGEARSGDQIAFLLLYQRHGNPIFRFLYRLLGSAEIAEDITHDCFLSLIRGSEKSSSSAPASLRIGLYSTARTLAMQYLRNSGQARVEKESGKFHSSSTEDKPTNEPQDRRLVSEVEEAVASLPTVEREALILWEYEGLEMDEIAAIVGTDMRTVAARLESARLRLRNALCGPPL